MGFWILVFCAVVAVLIILTWMRNRAREAFIEQFTFPNRLALKLKQTYPHLTPLQVEQVLDGLKTYFCLCNTAGRKMVAMPSQVVDVAWHEFILFTRQYQLFCKRAFGRFLHHTPAEAMTSPTSAQKGIQVAWRLACLRERITPKSPNKLPMLFALDAALKIEDGFHYSLDCGKNPDKDNYCASSIGCSSCGGGCSGDSGCGGGCGGD